MKRNQYKLLAEKYSTVRESLTESDKEDILAGLEQLSKIPPVVYKIERVYCRGEYDRYPAEEITAEDIREEFYSEDAVNYFREFTPDFMEYEELIDELNNGRVVSLSGEETVYTFCTNLQELEAAVDDAEEQEGYNM